MADGACTHIAHSVPTITLFSPELDGVLKQQTCEAYPSELSIQDQCVYYAIISRKMLGL